MNFTTASHCTLPLVFFSQTQFSGANVRKWYLRHKFCEKQKHDLEGQDCILKFWSPLIKRGSYHPQVVLKPEDATGQCPHGHD